MGPAQHLSPAPSALDVSLGPPLGRMRPRETSSSRRQALPSSFPSDSKTRFQGGGLGWREKEPLLPRLGSHRDRPLLPHSPACLLATFFFLFFFNSVYFFSFSFFLFFFLRKKQNRAGQNVEKETRSLFVPLWEAYFFIVSVPCGGYVRPLRRLLCVHLSHMPDTAPIPM